MVSYDNTKAINIKPQEFKSFIETEKRNKRNQRTLTTFCLPKLNFVILAGKETLIFNRVFNIITKTKQFLHNYTTTS